MTPRIRTGQRYTHRATGTEYVLDAVLPDEHTDLAEHILVGAKGREVRVCERVLRRDYDCADAADPALDFSVETMGRRPPLSMVRRSA